MELGVEYRGDMVRNDSAFFNAVEVWVGALYIMEADKTGKLYVRDTPTFSAAS